MVVVVCKAEVDFQGGWVGEAPLVPPGWRTDGLVGLATLTAHLHGELGVYEKNFGKFSRVNL